MIMGTFTSQILVGKKHSYDGGIINITHTLYLSENSRSAWMLTKTDLFDEKINQNQRIIWIPTYKNMLEDALVMIGLYVLKDDELLSLANQYFSNYKKNYVELYEDIKQEHLQKLYDRARNIESSHKILISVFKGSSIWDQLPVLKHYQNDIEVCRSVYKKEFSLWTNRFEEVGNLDYIKDIR